MNDMTLLNHQIKTVNTVCDALFGSLANPVKEPTLSVLDCLHLAHRIEGALIHHAQLYEDKRGNLDEAVRLMADVSRNLAGHLKDIENGVEA